MESYEDLIMKCIKIADDVANQHKQWSAQCVDQGFTDHEAVGAQNGAREVAAEIRKQLGFRKRDYTLPDWEETKESIYD